MFSTINFNNIYGWIALITTGIIVIQFILSFVVGEFDVDVDADGDVDFDLSTLVSPKGILHFLCGSCWYMVLQEEKLWYHYIIAILVGLAIMIIISLVYWGMHKLTNYVAPEVGEDLINRSGSVYLSQSEGQYIIRTTINGSYRELSVVSESKRQYNTGDIVVIKSYKDGIYFID